MWIPKPIVEFLKISKEAVDDFREELAVTRAERDALRVELATLKTNFDWLRIRVNSLEFENKALIERAYDIKLPAPELVRAPTKNPIDVGDLFGDIGDDLAKALGQPIYGAPTISEK